MERMQGKPLPLGVTVTKDQVNFAVEVASDSTCQLVLCKKGKEEPEAVFDMGAEEALGEVRFLSLKNMGRSAWEYYYLIDGEIQIDPYVKKISGREVWGEPQEIERGQVRGVIERVSYDWEGDQCLHLPANEVIAYSLHVRGFTRHSASGARHKGTFRGVIEKIPYLLDLGINQIHCMPIYEFEERGKKPNYWGYGPAYFFAPKSAYAACGDGVKELKDLVKACHRAGIEVVLEMPFDSDTSKQMMEECLRYYLIEYHIDGFILNPVLAPLDSICSDPILKKTKILTHQQDFQNTMRRFLKGDEGMVGEVAFWLRHKDKGIYNYITGQNGFTLNDLVSYDGKHNEANGENNQDGPYYNFSWNCGAEGPSRKKAVTALRERQIRNAFLLLLFAQGTPCILAGDEFGNSQDGNNNAYCQDNTVGWLDWNKRRRMEGRIKFVKEMIAFRKAHPVFAQPEPLKGMDTIRCGVPDVSYHGEHAWRMPTDISSRQLGVYYCGEIARDTDVMVLYNMYWLERSFALPALGGKKQWYITATSERGVLEEPVLLEDQHDLKIDERSIVILTGK